MPVTVQGPDGKTYQFPDGTDKPAAIAYFKRKGIGVSAPTSLTSNPEGQGLYEMTGPSGTIKVPFSKIPEAAPLGYKFANTGEMYRWAKDARALQPGPLAPNDANNKWISPTEFFKGGVASLWNMVRHPIDTAASMGEIYTASGMSAGGMYPGFVMPGTGNTGRKAEQSHKKVQQEAQQDIAAQGKFAREHPAYTAGGIVIPGLVTAGVEKGIEAIPGSKMSMFRSIVGTGPRIAEDLAEKTAAENLEATKRAVEKNRDLSEAHKQDILNALHETKGKESAHQIALRNEAEQIRIKDATEAERLRLEQEKEANAAKSHNERVRAKHANVAKRIQEENQAQENMLRLRQQREADLKQATDAYYAQEEAVDKAAKAKENEAWGNWRTKMKGKTIDGGEIAAPLQKLRLDSPEVDRTLRQLEPRGDEVPQESPYYRLRDQTATSNFGASYDALSQPKQEAVDRMMVSSGESPDPIDLDPQAGQPISVERVQRANSILQRYIRSGRFEGPLLGEMKQVAKVLRRAVTNASDEYGALGDLENARSETIRYQEAFGRERPEPRTVRGERERTANPEEKKALQEQERLDAAAKHSPELAEAQKRVRAARDELKKLPSEDQLRKNLKPVPPPPTVNDLREGFRLKPEPSPSPKRLTTGSPEERAAQTVEQPPRADFKDRPTEVVPEQKPISPEDVRKANEQQVKHFAHLTQTRGTSIAIYVTLYRTLAAVARGMFGNPRALESVPGDVAEGIGLVIGSHWLARAMQDNPTLHEMLVEPTPAQLKAIPPDLRSELVPVITESHAEGIKLSPAFVGAVLGQGAVIGPNTRKLREIQSTFNAAPAQ